MGNSNLESLIKTLGKLPGVGPRQARRFAYALTRQNGILANEVSNILNSLKGTAFSCNLCGATSIGVGPVCDVCSTENRDPKILALVATQEDYDSLWNMENYRGMLAIVPFPIKIESVQNEDPITKSYIQNTISHWVTKGLEEIILAFPISPEGEIMESMMLDFLDKMKDDLKPTITSLGRGMSLGSRLSESDDETIRYALGNRKRAI
jgi:recombination protein RecR